ncbi:MAG: sigma-54-dependent Fis family transcriptional regulator [Planctomycetes bacterium]|nr:sigma-54-dependent Fis family transcriptional regulator [Planctomycetota bacterium]
MSLRILIADDEPAARYGMAKALAGRGYEILEAADGQAALEAIRGQLPDLVFLDLAMPERDGLSILRELSALEHAAEIIVVTASDRVETAVECMRLGAADYLTKPFEVERLRAIAERAAQRLALERRVRDLEGQLEKKSAFGALVGSSRPMLRLYEQMERAARAPIDLLIRGETGTGKELIAKEIHRLSGRAGPFVAVNTAAIAESLAESELFGHVRGAFTGASTDRLGCFQQAHGGTLFLDEIGDMPLPAQAKILRALEERCVLPVGSSKPVAVELRVISATHQDLAQAVSEGHFRQDLFYRIRGLELQVPPLRDRREDIPHLAGYFLDRLAARLQSEVPRLSGGAMAALLSHSWPGNVRELDHVITAAAAMTAGKEILPGDLEISKRQAQAPAADFSGLLGLPLTEAKARLAETFERAAITAALETHGGNVSAAARQLGIHRQSLQQKMAQLGIPRKLDNS